MVSKSSTGQRSPFPLRPCVTSLLLGVLAWTAAAHADALGTWTPVPNQVIRPVARTGHTLVPFDGAALLYGGRAPAPSGVGTVSFTDLWEYTANSGKFSRLSSSTPLPPARSGHAAAAAPGSIFMYVFSGKGEDGALRRDVWCYDHFRLCWEQDLPGNQLIPAARMEQSAVAMPDGTFLMFGGKGGDGTQLLGDLWRYNPSSRTWTTLPDFPGGGRYGHAAAWLDGRMYVLGGTTADGPQNDLWVYDATQSTWAQLVSNGDLPGRFTGAAASAGDFGSGPRILLVGGQDETGTDLGSAYSISVNPVSHLAQWTRVADYTPVFQPGGATIARPSGQGSARNFLLFGGTEAGAVRDQASVFSAFTAPPPGVDLTATWLSQKSASKGKGTKLTWTLSGSVNVQNLGTQKSGASTLKLLLSDDPTADPGDTLLKQVKVAALLNGKSKAVKWSFKLAAGAVPSGKYVIAVVNALAQVTETDETNNTVASSAF